jgi:hypothetical protein
LGCLIQYDESGGISKQSNLRQSARSPTECDEQVKREGASGVPSGILEGILDVLEVRLVWTY